MKTQGTVKILVPLIALFFCGVVILMERSGITREYEEALAKDIELEFTEAVEEKADCLVLTASGDEVGYIYEEMICFVLDDMRVSYDVLEVPEEGSPLELNGYDTLVITFQDWSVLGDNLLTVCDWVKSGGSMMNMCTPVPDYGFFTVAGKLGIESGGKEYAGISGFQVHDGAMIGSEEGRVYSFVSEEEEKLLISLDVGLSESSRVIVSSEDGSVPLLWECPYYDGKFVIINETITEKFQRGFVCLAYSLLEDVSIYPVINGSSFYLDDFPAPVPEGNGEYIKRDYGVSISSFYSTIWWPKVLQWIENYGITYTGLIIEFYSDDVEAPFDRNQAQTQFLSFGNMLLNAGGEIGFHGYNHMPLCLEGIDDERQYGDYELWKSREDMEAALTELYEFSTGLFPESQFAVYVPPSNIMSEAGREVLLETCPNIRILASIYLSDGEGYAYVQEFDVDEDGIINTPRIVSGLDLDEYQRITALSELNYHYVQSHFMHPDDLLDEDRGAKTGWDTLSSSFEEYLDWIYTSAPGIRNLTGSEMGTAVLQYDKLTVKRERTGKVLNVKIGGFSGEAHFLMRVNEGSFESMEGGTCEKMSGNLYAVHAYQDEIKIYLGD